MTRFPPMFFIFRLRPQLSENKHPSLTPKPWATGMNAASAQAEGCFKVGVEAQDPTAVDMTGAGLMFSRFVPDDQGVAGSISSRGFWMRALLTPPQGLFPKGPVTLKGQVVPRATASAASALRFLSRSSDLHGFRDYEYSNGSVERCPPIRGSKLDTT